MWYPLNKSINVLSVIAAVLATLLAVGEPLDSPATSGAGTTDEALIRNLHVASRHLAHVDADASQALREATDALVVALAHQSLAAEMASRQGARHRHQRAMPFFSFANLLPGKADGGS